MRIWIVNHYAIPPTHTGGTRHYNLARKLQEKGHEVLIIASNYNHLTHSFISKEKGKKIDESSGVPFLWLPVPAYKGNTIARFWNMLMFMRSLLKNKLLRSLSRPDIIIGSSPHLFAAKGAQELAKKLNCRFILEVRDLWPESLIDLGRFTAKHPLIKIMKKIEMQLYKSANKVISLLPGSHEYLIQNGVHKQDIVWLPNFIDIDAIPKNLVKIPDTKFTVMNAGAHGVANDLDTVLEAGLILQKQGLGEKIRICLIGEGPEKQRLKQLAMEKNITIVEFMDPVPKTHIYQVLNQADVFLMLLKKSPVFRWGISPNKLFDYLAMGRPIIFGVENPFNPVKEHHIGLSIPASDPKELAKAIKQLYELPEEQRNAMGSRGQEYVVQHHTAEVLATQLDEVLVKMIEPTYEC